MSRKKKRAVQLPATPPRFEEGTAIRVKPGAVHPHYPDIPMGGWKGEIIEVDGQARPPAYEVEWSEETLQRVHPIVEFRCERDEQEYGSTWVRETDIENDPNPQDEPDLEQPIELRPRPLDPNDLDDVSRAVFGLTSDDELPLFTEENLRRYHEHLSQRVRFPLPGVWLDDSRRKSVPHLVTMHALAPIEQATPDEGLFVEVTGDDIGKKTIPLALVEPLPVDRSSRLQVEAYRSWFYEQPADSISRPTLRSALLMMAALWTTMGTIVGASVATQDNALLAIQIGAVLVGLVGALIGSIFEMNYRRSFNLRPGRIGGVYGGTLLFGAIGAAAGCLILGFIGTIPGVILGFLLSKLVAALGRRAPGEVLCTFLGASLGSIAYAFYLDPVKAGWGSGYGALAGAGAAIFFVLTVSGYTRVTMKPDKKREPG